MKTIFFDLDGTLIDSRADITFAVNLTRQDFGLPIISLEEVVACIGDGMRVLLERAIPEQPEPLAQMLLRQREHYREHLLDNTVLYPGVVETLARFSAAGWRMAVVTNKPTAMTLPILEGLNILPFFSAVVGGGDCAQLKPDPALIYLAAERMGVALDVFDWMVGDHYTDLEAGRRANLQRCFCQYGFGEARGESYELVINGMDSDFFEACAKSRRAPSS